MAPGNFAPKNHAEENPGQRVYCLLGASTWWSREREDQDHA